MAFEGSRFIRPEAVLMSPPSTAERLARAVRFASRDIEEIDTVLAEERPGVQVDELLDQRHKITLTRQADIAIAEAMRFNLNEGAA